MSINENAPGNYSSSYTQTIKVDHDHPVSIAVGKNRTDKRMKRHDLMWSEFVGRLSQTTITEEHQAEFERKSKQEQDDIKDVGGYIGGTLKDGSRKAENLISRQIVTLDADHAEIGFCDLVMAKCDYCWLIHSTHRHRPDSPRFRLVIPLERPVNADEYQAVARGIAEKIGIDYFDDTTFQPNRLMYYPSTSADGEYIFKHNDRNWLSPDQILKDYPDWRDCKNWTNSTRFADHDKRETRFSDPRDRNGMIGLFCRAYNVVEAIDTFLKDIYLAAEDDPTRYTYYNGSTSNGLVIYDNKNFAYSFHGSDPAHGELLNSFDLVRIHKFGCDKESTWAMIDFAKNDPKVNELGIGEQHGSATGDADVPWLNKLAIDQKGEFKRTLTNLIEILSNDPSLKGIYYNEFRESIDVEGEVPWKRYKSGWNITDYAGLAGYIDKTYNIYSRSKLADANLAVALARSKHPVREYLNNLPPWDGQERLDRLLVDYLGADCDKYVAAVTRKILVAAIRRVMQPGIKFDTVLVLNGPQGIGKSTLISKLGGPFYSDSLSIADMRDKTAAEKLQGYWIIEIGELAGLGKMDNETLKSFISRPDDKYRASYGYSVEDHPRQCVLFGTTNHESGFLRDLTGSRRFWVVKVPGKEDKKPWDLNESEIEQIWAEALVRSSSGETLHLSGELEELAQQAQAEAFESDEREGLVRAYLDLLYPDDWDTKPLEDRREYVKNNINHDVKKGKPRETVCNLEIWCELFGREIADLRKLDSYAIGAIMEKIPHWERSDSGLMKFPIYGRQRYYVCTGREQEQAGLFLYR